MVRAGSHSASFLCLVPRKEAWLVLGEPETTAADTGKQRQASFMPAAVFVQKLSQEKQGKKGPSPEPCFPDRETAGIPSCHLTLRQEAPQPLLLL